MLPPLQYLTVLSLAQVPAPGTLPLPTTERQLNGQESLFSGQSPSPGGQGSLFSGQSPSPGGQGSLFSGQGTSVDGQTDILGGQSSIFGGQGSLFSGQGTSLGGQGSLSGGQAASLGGQIDILSDGSQSSLFGDQGSIFGDQGSSMLGDKTSSVGYQPIYARQPSSLASQDIFGGQGNIFDGQVGIFGNQKSGSHLPSSGLSGQGNGFGGQSNSNSNVAGQSTGSASSSGSERIGRQVSAGSSTVNTADTGQSAQPETAAETGRRAAFGSSPTSLSGSLEIGSIFGGQSSTSRQKANPGSQSSIFDDPSVARQAGTNATPTTDQRIRSIFGDQNILVGGQITNVADRGSVFGHQPIARQLADVGAPGSVLGGQAGGQGSIFGGQSSGSIFGGQGGTPSGQGSVFGGQGNQEALVSGSVLSSPFTASLANSNKVHATCKMTPAEGAPYNVTGTVDFLQSVTSLNYPLGLLEVRVQLTGFPSDDNIVDHGMHVHTYGDLRDGCSASGGHYNPLKSVHGARTSPVRHVGDFGNIREDQQGNVNLVFKDKVASLVGDHSIMGRALVVHENKDDSGMGGNQQSLKNGNSGSPVACCVIAFASQNNWSGIQSLGLF